MRNTERFRNSMNFVSSETVTNLRNTQANTVIPLNFDTSVTSSGSLLLTFQSLAVTLRTVRVNIKKFYMVLALR